jgi:prolipoprotein diacylglyceryltransferase
MNPLFDNMIPLEHQQFKIISFSGINLYAENIFFSLALIIFFSFLITKLVKQKKITKPKETVLSIAIMLSSIFFFGRLMSFLLPWKGISFFLGFFYLPKWALNSFGMIIGGALGIAILVLYAGNKNSFFEFLELADEIIPYVALSIIFFRTGCLLDGHIIGKQTNVLWCIEQLGSCRHPIALYLILGALFLFLIFKSMQNNWLFFRRRFLGEISCLFILLYSSIRMVVSFFLETPYRLEIYVFLSFLILFILYILIDSYVFILLHNVTNPTDYMEKKKKQKNRYLPFTLDVMITSIREVLKL